MGKKVKIKIKCTWCKGKKRVETSCGGDRYSMWLCHSGDCGVDHKMEECRYCKGTGISYEVAELYEEL